MSPAKLLGLPQTEDSIIVRADGPAALRPRPQLLLRGHGPAQDGRGLEPGKVLRSLIAFRKRGDK